MHLSYSWCMLDSWCSGAVGQCGIAGAVVWLVHVGAGPCGAVGACGTAGALGTAGACVTAGAVVQ